MTEMDVHGPRRLIEVELPIREISQEARREKSIRHGHISTLHIWWARRPLAACRAVGLAALLPDPTDERCPKEFRRGARRALRAFRDNASGPPLGEADDDLRDALLRFIGRFASWDESTRSVFLTCARSLVHAAYPDGPPLVVDPFAGGGAIPLEALRVGADVWSSDHNAVAALLQKSLLEDMPKYGGQLADALAKWGTRVSERVSAEIGHLYPLDDDGGTPIAYLWARVVSCEGPGCGAEIPLLHQLWLSRKEKRPVALVPVVVADGELKRVTFEIVENPTATVPDGTAVNGAAVCPACSFVTPRRKVETQLRERRGGTNDAHLVAVVVLRPGQDRRYYRLPTHADLRTVAEAVSELRRRERRIDATLIPDGVLNPVRPSPAARGVSAVTRYGVETWRDLFLPRQLLMLSAFSDAAREARDQLVLEGADPDFARAVSTLLAFAVDRLADRGSALCSWDSSPKMEALRNTFARQALSMTWDFAEGNPFSGASGDWDGALDWIGKVCLHVAASKMAPGQASRGDARTLPLPDRSVSLAFTDPPYYDQIPYADLSDFFAGQLFRTVGHLYPDWLNSSEVDKSLELVVNAGHRFGDQPKDRAFFRAQMKVALDELRRVLTDDGLAVLVFAHKETEGWEALLGALVDAGWTVTGSWPIETEMASRLRARKAASLQSSIHIVCRPRPHQAGVGDWRRVRAEVEARIAEWLPRLSRDGIEGADAIFACLGPAMEAYTRFERVETASGDFVPLSPPRERPDAPAMLPTVWGSVAKEALRMIFEGSEAEGLDEDARLTALWLWTIRAAANRSQATAVQDDFDDEGQEPAGTTSIQKGFALDYDTARKLAQALGVRLEDLDRPGGIIQLKGTVARLVSVADRRRMLLGAEPVPKRGNTLFDDAMDDMQLVEPSHTTLDRVHQGMLLFASGRRKALRALLKEVADERFRRLSRALSALYPTTSSEKRWVDGLVSAMRTE
jgi:adenine-specific DNA methylase